MSPDQWAAIVLSPLCVLWIVVGCVVEVRR